LYESDYDGFPLSPHCYDLSMSAHKTLLDQNYLPWKMAYYARGASSPAGVRQAESMVCPRLRNQLRIYGPGSHNYVMSHYANLWLNGYSRYTAATATHTYSLGLHNNRSGPYRNSDAKRPDTLMLLADAPVITYAPTESHAYKDWGYEGYIISQTGFGNDRTIGNQTPWGNTWTYGRLTHDHGPNVLYWDGHAALYRYPNLGKSPMMPATMQTADGSGQQKQNGTPYVP